MTEAMRGFLIRQGYEQPEAKRCEELLRAFVAEVRSRKHSGTPLYALGESFEEVVRELLGE